MPYNLDIIVTKDGNLNLTSSKCLAFLQNPSKNPFTGKPLKKDSLLYQQLETKCYLRDMIKREKEANRDKGPKMSTKDWAKLHESAVQGPPTVDDEFWTDLMKKADKGPKMSKDEWEKLMKKKDKGPKMSKNEWAKLFVQAPPTIDDKFWAKLIKSKPKNPQKGGVSLKDLPKELEKIVKDYKEQLENTDIEALAYKKLYSTRFPYLLSRADIRYNMAKKFVKIYYQVSSKHMKAVKKNNLGLLVEKMIKGVRGIPFYGIINPIGEEVLLALYDFLKDKEVIKIKKHDEEIDKKRGVIISTLMSKKGGAKKKTQRGGTAKLSKSAFVDFVKKYSLTDIKYLDMEKIKPDFIKIYYKYDKQGILDDDMKLGELLMKDLDDLTGSSRTEKYGESWLYTSEIDLDIGNDFLNIFKK